MELLCKVQNYEWGKKGLTSEVAKLCLNANKFFRVVENVPYAELWMGTHVNAPSILKETNKPLGEYIEKFPNYLGETVIKEFGYELPFLFKVLSVGQALSIQAHPSKELAQELHSKFPNIYKDPNHKPELAIALTEFEALCGFRPIDEIKNFMKEIPELNRIVDWKNLQNKSDLDILKDGFKAVLTCEKEVIAKEVQNLINRQCSLDEKDQNSQLTKLVSILHSSYPNDVGIFVIYFLNYLKLQPSEALYLGANEPHAYLSGDCIECMACSDNVVRAGLTPKFIDVSTLCSMLKYVGEKPCDKLFQPQIENDFSRVFRPPVRDFAVAEIKVPVGKLDRFVAVCRPSASILIVISGCAKIKTGNVIRGNVLFLPADETVEFFDITEDLIVYQAFANV